MPLIRIDIVQGHTDSYIDSLMEGVHRAMVEAFEVPERDRYQIVSEHRRNRLVVQDTGLDIPRTDKVTLISVTSRPRSVEAKQRFYRLLCSELEQRCAIAASDIMVSIISNQDEDWSFGWGRAQFLTGEL
ncbi:tautomerase family protein [Pseudomonas sp.]|uniref:tautomerase family protein n=1 Tax=Pseudomonas sp. TaxID=306 RepID=UPI0028B0B71A|nr:tautomerase family protein [Pseudomonas sp.]